ncbi:MAG: VanZ family protein [Butyricicoccus pullicaecorum]|nr:VanZ family protein [Butyricicoccus pullicaecorum]
MGKAIRIIAFVLWLVVTGCNLYIELRPNGVVGVPVKLLFAAAFVLLWTIAFPPTRQNMGKWFAMLFLYYIWVLLNLLFFDAAFGRHQTHDGINLQPFYTIRNYLRAYNRGYIPDIAMLNLLGNIAAFAPMGFFLPSLFRKMGNLFIYVPCMLLMICGVEVAQVVTNCGSGDIDDLILNMAGAFLSWLILWPLSRHVNNRLRGYKYDS